MSELDKIKCGTPQCGWTGIRLDLVLNPDQRPVPRDCPDRAAYVCPNCYGEDTYLVDKDCFNDD